MSFTFVREPRVWWPVTVRVPADGGGHVEQKFEARLRIVPAGAFSALLADGQARLLAEVVENWRGIVDEDGVPLPFSQAALKAMIELPFIAAALAEAYAEAMLTGARKN